MNSEIRGAGLCNWNREKGGGYYLNREICWAGVFTFNRELRGRGYLV